MADTNFTAQSYREAALEHLSQAQFLHSDARRYSLTHYIAGVAIECMLRAHGLRADDEFTGRHDLIQLALRANFFDLGRGAKRPEYIAEVTEANLRWRSNHRYFTQGQLRSHLNDVGVDQRIRGDKLKYNSQRMYNLAEEIVRLGELKWNKK